jgi:AraC family transcriptional regulator
MPAIPHLTSTEDFENYLPTVPFLTSQKAGWESVMMRVYQEPSFLEETMVPGSLDIHLSLVTSGAVQVDERDIQGSWMSYPVHKGDWFLAPAGSEPYIRRWKTLSNDPFQTLQLHVSADLFARTVQQMMDRDPAHVTLVERSGFRDPLLDQLALSLRQELQQPAPEALGKIYVETTAQMLTVHLLRHYASTDVSIREYSKKLPSHQLRRLTLFIQEHLSQNLSLETLAQQVGFSPYHFARLFRQTTGESPHHFVLRQRLATAERLLKETNLPLVSVATEVGFSDQSHFTQVFKQYRGMTPSMYRRQR